MNTLFTSRMISLSLLMVGGLLCCVPNTIQDVLTQYLYDALSPGVVYVQPYFKSSQQHVAERHQLPPQVYQQCALLWAENSKLKQLATDLQQSPLRNLPQQEFSPLVSRKIIPATILTTSQITRWQQELILKSEQPQGIAKGDFVVSQTEFLIDQGELAGISPEALLLTGSVVIGQVTQVGRQTAKVKRIVDTEFRGAARLLRLSVQGPLWGAMGSLHGTGESTCVLDYVKLTEPVSIGDYVVALNPETKQFLGPVFGTVSKVMEQPGKTDWQIEVTPLFQDDPLTLPIVHILSEELHTSRILQVNHEQDTVLQPVPAEKFPGSVP